MFIRRLHNFERRTAWGSGFHVRFRVDLKDNQCSSKMGALKDPKGLRGDCGGSLHNNPEG